MVSNVSLRTASIVDPSAHLAPLIVEKNIVFLTFLAAPQGLTTVHSAFPGVRVVTASVGDKIEEREFAVHEHVILGTAARDADTGGRHRARQTEHPDRSSGRSSKGASEVAPGKKHAWVISPGEFHASCLQHAKERLTNASVFCKPCVFKISVILEADTLVFKMEVSMKIPYEPHCYISSLSPLRIIRRYFMSWPSQCLPLHGIYLEPIAFTFFCDRLSFFYGPRID